MKTSHKEQSQSQIKVYNKKRKENKMNERMQEVKRGHCRITFTLCQIHFFILFNSYMLYTTCIIQGLFNPFIDVNSSGVVVTYSVLQAVVMFHLHNTLCS